MKIKQMTNRILALVLVCLIFAVSGCGVSRQNITRLNSLELLSYPEYPEFVDNLDFQGVQAAIDHSLTYFKKVPLDRSYHYGKDVYTAAHMIESLEVFKGFLQGMPSSQELNQFIRSYYHVYASVGDKEGQVLFTGYYEPIYIGSLTGSEDYPYPIYSRPDDLVEIHLSEFGEAYEGSGRLTARVDMEEKKVVPYYSRDQINEIQDFTARSEPVAWLKSRVDRFFLEIQGSGRVILSNGDQIRVHYVANNGQPYSSIGRYLIEKGEISKEKMSMQAIKLWLDKNPDRLDEVLHVNKSVVFFQVEEGGPYGSLGVEVTALRTIATDRRLFPKGALCFIRTQIPDPDLPHPDPAQFDRSRQTPLWPEKSFFVMNQDTGGAIKGAARADIFFGNGKYAEYAAGHMNNNGKMYFLVLKKAGSH